MAAQEQAERDKEAAAAKVEQDKKDAADVAEREKQAAIQDEKDRQQRLAEAEEAEKKRLADIEAERVADENHRDSIEAGIADAINEVSSVAEELGQNVTEAILVAIIDSEIPHLTIEY